MRKRELCNCISVIMLDIFLDTTAFIWNIFYKSLKFCWYVVLISDNISLYTV